MADKNILIFPQERATSYIDKIEEIDLLIVDEFYKASSHFDKERSSSLLKAIIKLSKKANQRYFLAPNIHEIKDNVFTKGMRFVEMLDFNTVFLEKHDIYKEINKDEELKTRALLKILDSKRTKSLIYAGTYTNIDTLSTILTVHREPLNNPLLDSFAAWLSTNYSPHWPLVNLVRRGTAIHNGQLHRSISQIQVKLFDEEEGFDNIISTSSIIEGVNTSAENVILWKNKLGARSLNDFTYKNIIGRGGRMFRHFIGKIYLLEAPPKEETTQLEIPFPDEILGDLDEVRYSDSLTNEQVSKIIAFRDEMYGLIGKPAYDRLKKENVFQISNSEFIKTVARGMKDNPDEWNGLAYLNSDDPESWGRLLYKIIVLQPGGWDAQYRKVVAFIKAISKNWTATIPELLEELDEHDIGIDLFFKLERVVSFKFSAVLSDVNELQKEIINKGVDVAPFISKLSHAFLPSAVYQLEEYGLPRMVSKKLQRNNVINFMDDTLTLDMAIRVFQRLGKERVLATPTLDSFDKYILEFFYDGITIDKCAQAA
ncbi:MAG: hypothetical protein WDN72_02570 [Alphaproteobacteria bacterium]